MNGICRETLSGNHWPEATETGVRCRVCKKPQLAHAAFWCPACLVVVELGDQAQTSLVPNEETKAVCGNCGTELEGCA